MKALLAFAAAAVLLAATNPARPQYEAWLRRSVTSEAGGTWAARLVGGAAAVVGQATTSRTDYGILSLYTTRLPGCEVRAVGVLSRFIRLRGC